MMTTRSAGTPQGARRRADEAAAAASRPRKKRKGRGERSALPSIAEEVEDEVEQEALLDDEGQVPTSASRELRSQVLPSSGGPWPLARVVRWLAETIMRYPKESWSCHDHAPNGFCWGSATLGAFLPNVMSTFTASSMPFPQRLKTKANGLDRKVEAMTRDHVFAAVPAPIAPRLPAGRGQRGQLPSVVYFEQNPSSDDDGGGRRTPVLHDLPQVVAREPPTFHPSRMYCAPHSTGSVLHALHAPHARCLVCSESQGTPLLWTADVSPHSASLLPTLASVVPCLPPCTLRCAACCIAHSHRAPLGGAVGRALRALVSLARSSSFEESFTSSATCLTRSITLGCAR